MAGIASDRLAQLRDEFTKVERILASTPAVDKYRAIELQEYQSRQRKLFEALQTQGLEVGFMFSDEHYDGDVPYLGGNTNVQIEQIAGVVGRHGFHVAAGLEGGYIAEQLCPRAGAQVHKVEMLKLADEEYPINAKRLEDVVELAAGGPVKQIGLLSPREVVPAAVVEYLEGVYGRENVVDCQSLYYAVKYAKSDAEMRLIEDANIIADAMIRSMLDVAIRGISDYWDDVVIPGMDFVVIENTCGKYGTELHELNAIPHSVQSLVGNVDEME